MLKLNVQILLYGLLSAVVLLAIWLAIAWSIIHLTPPESWVLHNLWYNFQFWWNPPC